MASSPYVTKYSNQTVAQVLLLYLGLEGVNKVFGIPGGGLANLLVEFKNQRDKFDYIVCRHETGAAYIADGYYRATGNLGVVMVTSGPGATNALTGAMNAQNDGSAMLVITGEVSEAFFGKGYLQEGLDTDLDVHAIYNASACYSAELTDESEVQTLVEQALRDALNIPRGMSHLSIPNNVPNELVTTAHGIPPLPAPPPPPDYTIYLPANPANYRALPTAVDRDQVRQAVEQLLACKRPLIFLGSGCREALRDSTTLDALVVFAERYGIPVMTTPDGKGVFPESHSLSLRVYGFASNTWAPMWMTQTDLPYDGLLVLGTSLRGLSSNNWNPMLVPQNNGPFIQVDLQQQAIGRTFPITMGIVGEVGAFIREMGDLMPQFPPVKTEVQARVAEVATIKQTSPYYSQPDYDSNASPIEPAAIVRVLQATLPHDCLIFLDCANCVGWGIHYFTVDGPQQIHSSLAMGPMGFGVCAVVGGKIGCPDKTCIALVGDGAFMMHGAEVSTAQAHNVGAIWVVLQDDDLHMVSQGMNYLYHDPAAPDVWSQLYQLGKPDLVKFAEGLGADAYLINSPAELQSLMPKVLDRADNQNRPQVIVAKINKKSLDPYFPPPPKTPAPPTPPAQNTPAPQQKAKAPPPTKGPAKASQVSKKTSPPTRTKAGKKK
jgi:acetolactate synthase-1/2/3 large subunit